MLKTFPIEFIRQIFETKLFEEHEKDNAFFGGENQINIFSFYEQLKNQDEIDRFVDTYRDLAEQQNRTGLIGNGVVLAPENPSITNLYSSTIIPMTFTCSFRCTLENRDRMIWTINNLIEKLKGRKVDIAQLDGFDDFGKPCAIPFVVGTIGQNDGNPTLKNGDFIGAVSNNFSNLNDVLSYLIDNGVIIDNQKDYHVYCQNDNKLKVMRLYFYGQYGIWAGSFLEDDGTIDDIVFPPTHTSFEKYKVSFSFDSVRCDEPRTLNAQDYCEISFGGSATLVNASVVLGNDLLKIKVSKEKIVAKTVINYNSNYEYLEPLEMPSGNNVNSEINQLVSNNFKSNSHADAIAVSLQYTFMVDYDSDLIKNWFAYARYGIHSTGSTSVSPNTIYLISEMWSMWGEFALISYRGKIVENIDVENTESDALTLSVSFQLQGDSN